VTLQVDLSAGILVERLGKEVISQDGEVARSQARDCYVENVTYVEVSLLKDASI
jgi:hypothetical protein